MIEKKEWAKSAFSIYLNQKITQRRKKREKEEN